jgi:hypothetical protein
LKLRSGNIVLRVSALQSWMQIECIRGNVLGCINLADICNERGLHMTYFGTGCIFHYDDDFKVNTGKERAM